MEEERVKPLGQVMADGYVSVTDNINDFSGSVVHPKEGPGMYMAPLDASDPRALATRIHEYTHLQLITSELQPTGLHAAFEAAGIEKAILQAMADAKVMTYCQSRGVSLKDLVVISKIDDEASRRVKAASKMRQANLLLRAIGTDTFDFADKTVTLLPKQKKHIVHNIFPKIREMKTLEDWVRIGMEYQRAFETAKIREKRKEKTKEYMPAGSEGKEEEEKDKTSPKKRESMKQDMEKFKDISKKIVDKLRDEGALKPKSSPAEAMEEKGETSTLGGKAVSKEKEVKKPLVEEKAKTLEVYEKEMKEKSELERLMQEVEENLEDLDSGVLRKFSANKSDTMKQIKAQVHSVEWGKMKVISPLLEKPFEPKNRSKRTKRSYVGAFRYPHRIVSDSAVFASKQKGKGGTLLIDGSGSMGLTFQQILEVLEQRPFASIALYCSEGYRLTCGELTILVDRGKRITEAKLEEILKERGGGNVVDGPAIDWLCKRSGEKFWICDGGVTGVDDRSSTFLQAYVALKERRYKIKRWYSIKDFIAGKLPTHG